MNRTIQRINWKPPYTAYRSGTGRKGGWYLCGGIEAWYRRRDATRLFDIVTLTAINGRSQLGCAVIEIPLAQVRELAQALLDFAEAHKQEEQIGRTNLSFKD